MDRPFVKNVLTGHGLNDGDGVFTDAIFLDKIVELGSEHSLKEVLAVRDNDSVSIVRRGTLIVGRVCSTDDLFDRKELKGGHRVPKRLVILVIRVEPLADTLGQLMITHGRSHSPSVINY